MERSTAPARPRHVHLLRRGVESCEEATAKAIGAETRAFKTYVVGVMLAELGLDI